MSHTMQMEEAASTLNVFLAMSVNMAVSSHAASLRATRLRRVLHGTG